jgi:hypothetical protein
MDQWVSSGQIQMNEFIDENFRNLTSTQPLRIVPDAATARHGSVTDFTQRFWGNRTWTLTF